MYPTRELETDGQYMRFKKTDATVLSPQTMDTKFKTAGYTFDEMSNMTVREIMALKQATLDILAAKRQQKYSDIATILWLQSEIHKDNQ